MMSSGCCAPARSDTPREKTQASPAIVAGGGKRPDNPIFVRGGRTYVGTGRPELPQDGEAPRRPVRVKDFYLEAQTVTVARFAEFVAETGYVTEAEEFGWSAVFFGLLPPDAVATGASPDTPWWVRIEGANWRQPEGPQSSVKDRQDHPVTQVSLRDATAFATWAGGRLPTEAEWEHAARGGSADRRFPWGDEEPDEANIKCNIWQGQFPDNNTCVDGYMGTAPARSFEPSAEGFYNLMGNVWEWTGDLFRVRSVSRMAKMRNEAAAAGGDRTLKGGSFLCHISYCYRYRIAARMNLTPDSAASNVGFRIAFSDL